MSIIRILSATFLLGGLSLAAAQTPTDLPDLDLWNHGAVFTSEQESAGDLLIGGLFALAGGMSRNNIARVRLPEGQIDSDFAPIVNGPVFVILQQPNGRILIGGRFSRVNGAVRNNIARINADGSLDASWNPGANEAVYVLALDNADHVIVGGSFSQISSQARRGLARLTLSNGQVDGDWDPDVRGGSVFALARGTSDFWIGGSFDEVGGQSSHSMARLSADGALVAAYDVDGNVESLSYDNEHGLYFCGRFSTVNGQPRSRIARLDLDGSLDAFSISVDQDVHECEGSGGKILVGGQFQSINGAPVKGAARLMSDGVVDPDFRPAIDGVFTGTEGTDTLVWTVRELGSGLTFAGGVFRRVNDAPRVGAVLLNSEDGQALDPIHVERPAEVRTILRLDDDALIVGGGFWRSGQYLRDNLARVQPDGNLDGDWTLTINGEVLSADLLDDGDLVLGGFFSATDGQPRNNLVRVILENGPEVQPDWTTGTDGAVLVIQQDRLDSERLYVAGSFSEIQGSQSHARGAMARLSLLGNGEPDNFDPGFDGQVNDLLQAPSNARFYVAGVFEQADNHPRRGIAAFIDGAGQTQLDVSFDAEANGNLWVLHPAANGESFYAGGEFTSLFGETRTRLAMVGSGFEQWTPTTAGTPVALALDGVGGLYVGGTFLDLNGISRKRLGRLDANDGTLDSDFQPAIEPGLIWNLSVGSGKLFVAGSFQSVAGLPRHGLAGIEIETPPPPRPDLIFSDRFEISGGAGQPRPREDGQKALDATWSVECADQIALTGRNHQPPFIKAPSCN